MDTSSPAMVQRGPIGATMVTAEVFARQLPHLGLNLPLALRGGEPDAFARLGIELGLVHHGQLRSIVEQALVNARDERSPWFRLPPLLLIGEPGVGRTHAARRIAYAAGIPHAYLDFRDPAGINQLWPSPNGPDLTPPAFPVLAMAIGGCANPIISVIGVEHLDLPSIHRFAEMIDPMTAGRFVDHPTGCRVDLRQISWLIQCSDPHEIPPGLSGLMLPIEMGWPDEDRLPLHVAEVLAEAAIDAGVIDQVGHQVDQALTHLSRTCRRQSTAEIYEAARLWLSAHCQ